MRENGLSASADARPCQGINTEKAQKHIAELGRVDRIGRMNQGADDNPNTLLSRRL
jgi:hypothetical protein